MPQKTEKEKEEVVNPNLSTSTLQNIDNSTNSTESSKDELQRKQTVDDIGENTKSLQPKTEALVGAEAVEAEKDIQQVKTTQQEKEPISDILSVAKSIKVLPKKSAVEEVADDFIEVPKVMAPTNIVPNVLTNSMVFNTEKQLATDKKKLNGTTIETNNDDPSSIANQKVEIKQEDTTNSYNSTVAEEAEKIEANSNPTPQNNHTDFTRSASLTNNEMSNKDSENVIVENTNSTNLTAKDQQSTTAANNLRVTANAISGLSNSKNNNNQLLILTSEKKQAAEKVQEKEKKVTTFADSSPQNLPNNETQEKILVLSGDALNKITDDDISENIEINPSISSIKTNSVLEEAIQTPLPDNDQIIIETTTVLQKDALINQILFFDTKALHDSQDRLVNNTGETTNLVLSTLQNDTSENIDNQDQAKDQKVNTSENFWEKTKEYIKQNNAAKLAKIITQETVASMDSSKQHKLLITCSIKPELNSVVATLIKEGVDVNFTNNQDFTALMITTYDTNLVASKLLIDNGADVNFCNKDGVTALMATADVNKLEAMQLLIDSGALLMLIFVITMVLLL